MISLLLFSLLIGKFLYEEDEDVEVYLSRVTVLGIFILIDIMIYILIFKL